MGHLAARLGFSSGPQKKSPKQFGVGIPWTWYRSISVLQPEMGTKMAKKWILASLERAMFPPFFRSGENPFFSHFRPHFGPEARNGSIPAPRDSKVGEYFGGMFVSRSESGGALKARRNTHSEKRPSKHVKMDSKSLDQFKRWDQGFSWYFESKLLRGERTRWTLP